MKVRLPRDIAGEPPPRFTPEGFVSDGWEGSWKSPDGLLTVHIQKASSNTPLSEVSDPTERRLFIEPWEHGWYDFWTGYQTREVGRDENDRPVVEHEGVPDEWVARYREWREWLESVHQYGRNAVMDGFVEAGESSKSMDIGVSDRAVTILYGVKWFYAGRKLRFCRDLSRALRTAKRAGIGWKLLKVG